MKEEYKILAHEKHGAFLESADWGDPQIIEKLSAECNLAQTARELRALEKAFFHDVVFPHMQDDKTAFHGWSYDNAVELSQLYRAQRVFYDREDALRGGPLPVLGDLVTMDLGTPIFMSEGMDEAWKITERFN